MKKFLEHSLLTLVLLLAVACEREPDLHLYDGGNIDIDIPDIEVGLETYWEYKMVYGIEYDWKSEWYYGWDMTDSVDFGVIGYKEPKVFNLRRYYTARSPYSPHSTVEADTIHGTTFHAKYAWGFWDMLVWNEVEAIDGVQSLNIDENSLDSTIAYTNQSMFSARYQAPLYTHAFYQPEPLFTAYEQAIDINENLEGFEFDAERNLWIKQLNMRLLPVTYIYLTQVILHHNNGRVTGTDGVANLSGVARSMNMNSGKGGDDAITVTYGTRMKLNCNQKGELVDIVGGRLLTFGICGLRAQHITKESEILDSYHHYMDVKLNFNNGMDSTFVFDVTNQVRKRFKGGVITIELDMDTVPVPRRQGGSGFDAIVKDYEDGGTHEFDM